MNTFSNRKNSIKLTIAAAIGAAMSLTKQAQADIPTPIAPVTSLQFDGSGYGSITDANTTAGVVVEDNWNYSTDMVQGNVGAFTSTMAATGGGTPGTALVGSDGLNSGVTFSYNYTRAEGLNQQEGAFTGGDAQLSQESAGIQGDGAATLTISGLNTNYKYDIIAYVNPYFFSNGYQNGTPEEVTLGPTTYYLLASNTLSTWTQSTATSSGDATSSNYAEFDDLIGSTETLTLPDNGADFGLSGIQAIPVAAVPEPASISLLGIGSTMLLARRRRRT